MYSRLKHVRQYDADVSEVVLYAATMNGTNQHQFQSKRTYSSEPSPNIPIYLAAVVHT